MTKYRIGVWLSSCCFFAALVSCGKAPEDTQAVSKPAHPWDWVPTDPELITGKRIYLNECSMCHNEGESGAPRLGSTKKWTERSAKGLPTLIKNAIEGVNGPDGEMPPKGDSPHLTDEEVAAAVKFMVGAPK